MNEKGVGGESGDLISGELKLGEVGMNMVNDLRRGWRKFWKGCEKS